MARLQWHSAAAGACTGGLYDRGGGGGSSPRLHKVGGVAAVMVGAARVAEQALGVRERSQSRTRPEAGQRTAAEQVARRAARRRCRRPQLHLGQKVELTADGDVAQVVLRLQLVQAARLHRHGNALARLCR